MKLTQADYKTILKYYKLTIPKNHKKTLKKAENIIAKKLCSCIKKVEPKFKKEAPAIGICTKSVIGRKGYKRGKFSCKTKKTVKLYKGGRKRKGGCKSFRECFKKIIKKKKTKTRRKKRKRNKNEGKRSLTDSDVHTLKTILDSIIKSFEDDEEDELDELTGHHLIKYYKAEYKEIYIKINFDKLIRELAPDGHIRSDLFSFIEEEDRHWIENERNLQGCCTISG